MSGPGPDERSQAEERQRIERELKQEMEDLEVGEQDADAVVGGIICDPCTDNRLP